MIQPPASVKMKLFILLALVAIAACAPASSKRSDEDCVQRVDIGFLIDSSYSIQYNYDKELDFVEKLTEKFKISEDEARAGVIVFSSGATVAIKLNEEKSSEDFKRAVDRIAFSGGATRIDLAFERARTDLFTESNGARKGVPKIIFLVTDGNQSPVQDVSTGEKYDAVKESQELYNRGDKIFAVGIGSVSLDSLKEITRDPENVYQVDSVEELLKDDFVKSLSKSICTQVEKIEKVEDKPASLPAAAAPLPASDTTTPSTTASTPGTGPTKPIVVHHVHHYEPCPCGEMMPPMHPPLGHHPQPIPAIISPPGMHRYKCPCRYDEHEDPYYKK